MTNIISKILASVLTFLYQSFGLSVLVVVFFLFLYLYANEHG
ncbi:hypothetical protein F180042I2_06920 [Enterocloster bolteae]